MMQTTDMMDAVASEIRRAAATLRMPLLAAEVDAVSAKVFAGACLLGLSTPARLLCYAFVAGRNAAKDKARRGLAALRRAVRDEEHAAAHAAAAAAAVAHATARAAAAQEFAALMPRAGTHARRKGGKQFPVCARDMAIVFAYKFCGARTAELCESSGLSPENVAQIVSRTTRRLAGIASENLILVLRMPGQ